ncbi:Rac/Rho-like_protein [Hexamita inflata]|uniref:Rac/Rho-like protein n=1 Tax=Hexamita inflata TaxID=28002 RepID=A0AA86UER0_9EUKA|nr:Rac/Rho-like protein [Hexamita inflata]
MKIKCTVIGDKYVGKTSLIRVFSQQEFPKDYVPTVFANYTCSIQIEESETIELTLWDTAGDEDYDRLRPLCYPDSDIVLICYAINNQQSLNNVLIKWVPEIRHHMPNVPLVLVGTKNDLKYSARNTVQIDDVERVKFEIGACFHTVCSAVLDSDIRFLMNQIAQILKEPGKLLTKKKKCF